MTDEATDGSGAATDAADEAAQWGIEFLNIMKGGHLLPFFVLEVPEA